MRRNGKELQKHIKYPANLTISEKEYCQIANIGFINRRGPRETGLPNCELLIANGRSKYGAVNIIRLCRIRNYRRSKHGRRQVINRANTKLNITHNPHIHKRINKGMHIALPNDITLQMEIDYGRIKIINRLGNNRNTIRYII